MSEFKSTIDETQLVVVRHGARADCSEVPQIKSLVVNACNTCLDPKQSMIIINAGMFIKNNILHEDKFDQVISSPFLRCAETTYYLAGACNKVKFNGGISEVMHTRVLKEQIDKVNQIVKDDLQTIGISRQEINQINIPLIEETRGTNGSADYRFRNELTKIAEDACQSGYNKTLVVTHGDCIGSLVELCKIKSSVCSVDYCGILVANFNIVTKKWSLDYDKCTGVGIIKDDE